MTGRGKGRRLRADARRNREQILATVESLLPEHGPKVPMEEIARASGVGVGTLYRRFGGRDELIEATAEAAFQSVMANARAASGDPDAWSALTGFIVGSIADLKVVSCLSIWYPDAWKRVKSTAAEQQRRQALMEVLDGFVESAQAAGQLRDDVTADELAVMLALVLRPIPGRTDTPDASHRYVSLMLNGFRPSV